MRWQPKVTASQNDTKKGTKLRRTDHGSLRVTNNQMNLIHTRKISRCTQKARKQSLVCITQVCAPLKEKRWVFQIVNKQQSVLSWVLSPLRASNHGRAQDVCAWSSVIYKKYQKMLSHGFQTEATLDNSSQGYDSEWVVSKTDWTSQVTPADLSKTIPYFQHIHLFSISCSQAGIQKPQTANLPIFEAGLWFGAPFGAYGAVQAVVHAPHLQLLPWFGSVSNSRSRRTSGKFHSSAYPSSRKTHFIFTTMFSTNFLTTFMSIMVSRSFCYRSCFLQVTKLFSICHRDLRNAQAWSYVGKHSNGRQDMMGIGCKSTCLSASLTRRRH